MCKKIITELRSALNDIRDLKTKHITLNVNLNRALSLLDDLETELDSWKETVYVLEDEIKDFESELGKRGWKKPKIGKLVPLRLSGKDSKLTKEAKE